MDQARTFGNCKPHNEGCCRHIWKLQSPQCRSKYEPLNCPEGQNPQNSLSNVGYICSLADRSTREATGKIKITATDKSTAHMVHFASHTDIQKYTAHTCTCIYIKNTSTAGSTEKRKGEGNWLKDKDRKNKEEEEIWQRKGYDSSKKTEGEPTFFFDSTVKVKTAWLRLLSLFIEVAATRRLLHPAANTWRTHPRCIQSVILLT